MTERKDLGGNLNLLFKNELFVQFFFVNIIKNNAFINKRSPKLWTCALKVNTD